MSAGAETPPTFYAAACVDAARLHEQHDEPRAIDLYRMAVNASAPSRARGRPLRAHSPADASTTTPHAEEDSGRAPTVFGLSSRRRAMSTAPHHAPRRRPGAAIRSMRELLRHIQRR